MTETLDDMAKNPKTTIFAAVVTLLVIAAPCLVIVWIIGS
jgi:hypothetical protein